MILFTADPLLRRLLAAALACLGTPTLCAQDAKADAPRVERVTTPDGSIFLLAPDTEWFRAPIVHWVTLVPTDVSDDPVGAEGLAQAIVRSSLDGSGGTGSIDAERESAALDALDELERRANSARPDDRLAVEAELAAGRAAAKPLGIPDSWRRAIARAGGTDVEAREIDGASLIHLACGTESLPEIALLVHERRERPLLRNLHEHFADVRKELRATTLSPTGRMQAEILGTTFPGIAAARPVSIQSRNFTRAEALAEFRAIHHPSRGIHVLTGGFDVAQVRSVLRAIFATTTLPATTPTPSPAPADSRGRRSVLRGSEDHGMAIAWAMPRPDPAVTLATAEWLAGGRASMLATGLRGAGFGAVDVTFRVPFPVRARPGLVLIQIVGERGNPKSAELEATVLALLKAAAERGPSNAELGRVRARLTVADAAWRKSMREAAFVLAEEVGLRGRPHHEMFDQPATAEAEALTTFAGAMQSRAQRTIVVLEAQR